MALSLPSMTQLKQFNKFVDDCINHLSEISEDDARKIYFENENINIINFKNAIKELLRNVLTEPKIITKGTDFYRVRILDDGVEYYNRIKDFIYPPIENAKLGRLNSIGTQLLYLSSHELTAIQESRLQGICKNERKEIRFQLTRFQITEDIKVIEIGGFLEPYLSLPRDGEAIKKYFQDYIGSDYMDSSLRIISACEYILLKVLNNCKKNSYYLSSLLSEVVFEINNEFKLGIEGVKYQSTIDQSSVVTGMNIAFQKDALQKMDIRMTCVNRPGQFYFGPFMDYESEYYNDGPEDDDGNFKMKKTDGFFKERIR
ncbi:hypothetical protein C8351_05575 [Salmonella enterica]|nr:hypothetical protein [Salmonella enterica]ECE0404096.1 hypothetical protein [Salmonella enterica subsp. enterica]EBI8770282.1 hypothetical protein [Salmonella enterica]ECF2180487.1 hypothetical protein [Salmonella enterica subsp. enterica]EDV1534430.1 hypothetical protein [Salmonella enterica subsp. enterica]